MTPQEILDRTRVLINEYAAGDSDRWWYANRFVFARLQLDERKTKAGIKRELLDTRKPCHSCKQPFSSRRNVHLHRLDSSKGYTRANCVLMHPECHRKWHVERPNESHGAAHPTQVRKSRRYDDKPFLYWWDITPAQVEAMAPLDAIEFVKKDSGQRCSIPANVLKQYLTPQRQTRRSDGNWGVKVLPDRPDELALEPGTGRNDWVFLPVVWIDEHDD